MIGVDGLVTIGAIGGEKTGAHRPRYRQCKSARRTIWASASACHSAPDSLARSPAGSGRLSRSGTTRRRHDRRRGDSCSPTPAGGFISPAFGAAHSVRKAVPVRCLRSSAAADLNSIFHGGSERYRASTSMVIASSPCCADVTNAVPIRWPARTIQNLRRRARECYQPSLPPGALACLATLDGVPKRVENEPCTRTVGNQLRSPNIVVA